MSSPTVSSNPVLNSLISLSPSHYGNRMVWLNIVFFFIVNFNFGIISFISPFNKRVNHLHWTNKRTILQSSLHILHSSHSAPIHHFGSRVVFEKFLTIRSICLTYFPVFDKLIRIESQIISASLHRNTPLFGLFKKHARITTVTSSTNITINHCLHWKNKLREILFVFNSFDIDSVLNDRNCSLSPTRSTVTRNVLIFCVGKVVSSILVSPIDLSFTISSKRKILKGLRRIFKS